LINRKENTQTQPVRKINLSQASFHLHIINAFEDAKGLVHVDVLMYTSNPGFKVYQSYLQLKTLMNNPWPQEVIPMRYTINTQTLQVQSIKLTPGEKSLSAEFPIVNDKFRGRDYRYTYMLDQPFSVGSQILKLDVNSPTITSWSPPASIYPGPPVYVSQPGASDTADAEDAGILIVGAVDTVNKRGKVYIINAKDMKQIGVITSPNSTYTPFGMHNRYFERSNGRRTLFTSSVLCVLLVMLGVVSSL